MQIEYGNLFGSLALTPGPRAADDPADDGFLTLAEIYTLDLRRCELAILSACQTNDGPQQRGEGVWSLARGFLAAGAKCRKFHDGLLLFSNKIYDPKKYR